MWFSDVIMMDDAILDQQTNVKRVQLCGFILNCSQPPEGDEVLGIIY